MGIKLFPWREFLVSYFLLMVTNRKAYKYLDFKKFKKVAESRLNIFEVYASGPLGASNTEYYCFCREPGSMPEIRKGLDLVASVRGIENVDFLDKLYTICIQSTGRPFREFRRELEAVFDDVCIIRSPSVILDERLNGV